MKKREKEKLKVDIHSYKLILGQGIYQCVNRIGYKIEQSETLDELEMKELLRKLKMMKDNFDEMNEVVSKSMDLF